MMTAEELDSIKKKLPRGYRKELASRTGLSVSAIYDVFRGRYHSDKVIEEALKWAEEIAVKDQELRDKLNKLNNIAYE